MIRRGPKGRGTCRWRPSHRTRWHSFSAREPRSAARRPFLAGDPHERARRHVPAKDHEVAILFTGADSSHTVFSRRATDKQDTCRPARGPAQAGIQCPCAICPAQRATSRGAVAYTACVDMSRRPAASGATARVLRMRSAPVSCTRARTGRCQHEAAGAREPRPPQDRCDTALVLSGGPPRRMHPARLRVALLQRGTRPAAGSCRARRASRTPALKRSPCLIPSCWIDPKGCPIARRTLSCGASECLLHPIRAARNPGKALTGATPPGKVAHGRTLTRSGPGSGGRGCARTAPRRQRAGRAARARSRRTDPRAAMSGWR